jgi:type II secretory pathway pseudopilin PulG
MAAVKTCRRQGLAGFTLMELAIVLFIIALLIGGLLMPLSSQVDLRNASDTQKNLAEIRDALVGYAAANGRLPCPATSASNGLEAPLGGGACTACLPDCFLPAATLGVSPTDNQGYSVDAWRQRIRYAVTAANGNAFTTAGGMRASWSAPLAPNLRVCADSACATVLASNAVAVVYSVGANGPTGGTSADEMENPNPNSGTNPDPTAGTFVSHEQRAGFDDVVTWLSPNVLYNRMIAAGQLP